MNKDENYKNIYLDGKFFIMVYVIQTFDFFDILVDPIAKKNFKN